MRLVKDVYHRHGDRDASQYCDYSNSSTLDNLVPNHKGTPIIFSLYFISLSVHFNNDKDDRPKSNKSDKWKKFPYLCKIVQRLDDVSLYGELELDELLSESVLCLSTEL